MPSKRYPNGDFGLKINHLATLVPTYLLIAREAKQNKTKKVERNFLTTSRNLNLNLPTYLLSLWWKRFGKFMYLCFCYCFTSFSHVKIKASYKLSLSVMFIYIWNPYFVSFLTSKLGWYNEFFTSSYIRITYWNVNLHMYLCMNYNSLCSQIINTLYL
jgi:hypothetical protein